MDRAQSRLTREPLLTAEEEISLARRIAAGGKDGDRARDRLIMANMRMVVSIATRYKDHDMDLADAIQEGAIGLMEAARRFDPDKGNRFSTYATWWIRRAIGRAIDEKARTVRLPVYVGDQLRAIAKATESLKAQGIARPSAEELGRATGLTLKEIRTCLRASQPTVSIDAPAGDDPRADSIGAFLRDEETPAPEESALTIEQQAIVSDLIGTLPIREQYIIRQRMGFDGEVETLDDIGRAIGLTRERVRQLESEAMRRLKAPLCRDALAQYLRVSEC